MQMAVGQAPVVQGAKLSLRDFIGHGVIGLLLSTSAALGCGRHPVHRKTAEEQQNAVLDEQTQQSPESAEARAIVDQLTSRVHEWRHCYRAKTSEDPTVQVTGPPVDETPHVLVELSVDPDGTVGTATVVREFVFAQVEEGGGVRETKQPTALGECVVGFIKGIQLETPGDALVVRYKFQPEVASPGYVH